VPVATALVASPEPVARAEEARPDTAAGVCCRALAPEVKAPLVVLVLGNVCQCILMRNIASTHLKAVFGTVWIVWKAELPKETNLPGKRRSVVSSQ
jgi:hypothetical protein